MNNAICFDSIAVVYNMRFTYVNLFLITTSNQFGQRLDVLCMIPIVCYVTVIRYQKKYTYKASINPVTITLVIDGLRLPFIYQ